MRDYNTRIESVPSNIIANFAKFEKATYFEVNDPIVRQAPSVNFGEISERPAGQDEPQSIEAPRNDQYSTPYEAPQQQQQAPQSQPATPPQQNQQSQGGYQPPFTN